MEENQPQTYQRAFRALFAAVALATAAKAALVLVLPHLLQSSLSAFAGNLADSQSHLEMLKPLALLRGAIGAALCLTPSFLIAHRLRAGLSGYVLAGALAEFIHNLLSVLLLEPALSSLEYGTLFLAMVRPETLVLQGGVAIAIASLIAGALAGADFAGRIVPEERRKPLLYRRPVFLVPALAFLLAGWWVFHDREGDQLCAHTDMVRLSVDGTTYNVPAALQPTVEALDPHKPLHIFMFQYHYHSDAAAAAQNRTVYCQTADEPAWPVRSFAVIGNLAIAPAGLPKGMKLISISTGRTDAAPPKVAVEFSLPPTPGLDRRQGEHTAYIYVWPGGTHGMMLIRLADGTWMDCELDMDFADPAAAAASYRQLADFLTAYRVRS